MKQADLFSEEDTEVIPSDTKECNLCEERLPLTSFRSANGGGHLYPYCTPCNNHMRSVRTQLRKENPYPKQDYRCPVCDKNAEQLKRKVGIDAKVWCLDHDHKTDTFRGWVCLRCNFAAGQLRDSPVAAYKLYEYLKKHVD